MEGASEARRLSVRCGVPRTKVYPTLRKLIGRGLVHELPGKPNKFAPKSPSEAFGQYLSYFKENISERVITLMEAHELTSFLEEAYKKTQSNTEPQKDEVWILKSRSKTLRKIREMMSLAKRNVTVVTTEEGFVLFYKAFDKLLDKLVKKGVKVQMGTPINHRNAILARELNYVYKVEHVEFNSPLLYLCIDERDCFLVDLRSESELGVFCNNPAICELLSLLLPKL